MTGIQLMDYDIDVRVVRDEHGRIVSGLVLGDILTQNQALILQLRKGDLHGDVATGVGISDMTLDHDLALWRREIREQLELDGQTVDSVRITDKEIIINAKY